jgi:hypothetical protein
VEENCVCVCVCVVLFGEIKNTYDTVGLQEIDHLKDQRLDGLVILKLFIKTQEKCKVYACSSRQGPVKTFCDTLMN